MRDPMLALLWPTWYVSHVLRGKPINVMLPPLKPESWPILLHPNTMYLTPTCSALTCLSHSRLAPTAANASSLERQSPLCLQLHLRRQPPIPPHTVRLPTQALVMQMNPSARASKGPSEQQEKLQEKLQGTAFTARTTLTLETAMSLYKLTESLSFWEIEQDTRCLIGSGNNTVVVAFRGTASMKNALADLQVLPCLLAAFIINHTCPCHDA